MSTLRTMGLLVALVFAQSNRGLAGDVQASADGRLQYPQRFFVANKVVTNLLGAGATIVTSNGLGEYTITSSGGSGDAGGTNARQWGTLILTNAGSNPNLATNLSGSGSVTVTSNNVGGWTITGASADAGGTNSRQGGSLTLSNLDSNPYTGYTNKALQVAANRVLSNLQGMVSFYWTNGQASSMLLSNLVSANSWGYYLSASSFFSTNGFNFQNKVAITAPTSTNVVFMDWGSQRTVTLDASNYTGLWNGYTVGTFPWADRSTNYSGSTNRAFVGPVTNQWDLTVAPWQRMTNDTGLKTNLVFQLTNVLVGARQWTVIYGNKSANPSNEFFSVALAWPGGGSISWLGGLPTNGTYDCLVRSNQAVVVELFCDRATNVFARYSTNNILW